MDKNRFLLPTTLILASIILGGFYYAVQINKQKSIEWQQQLESEDKRRQQEIELEVGRRQQEAENALDNLKLKQEECKALSAGVMKKGNNVIGVTYDSELYEECVVTYTNSETGSVETTPLSQMQYAKDE